MLTRKLLLLVSNKDDKGVRWLIVPWGKKHLDKVREKSFILYSEVIDN